jgi:hypothetical protein
MFNCRKLYMNKLFILSVIFSVILISLPLNSCFGLQYVPGDANMKNGQWPPAVNGADVTYLVAYFRGINPACLISGFYCSADVNGDCAILGSDVTRLVYYFRGMANIIYCPMYVPDWLTPSNCPANRPAVWPGC